METQPFDPVAKLIVAKRDFVKGHFLRKAGQVAPVEFTTPVTSRFSFEFQQTFDKVLVRFNVEEICNATNLTGRITNGIGVLQRQRQTRFHP